MRASPATEITVCRFELWRLGVAALSTISLAAIGAWAHGRSGIAGSSVPILAVFALTAAIAAASAALRMRLTRLRWDGERWHVAEGIAPGDVPWTGRVEVAIDLGAWMLLRFWPDETRPWRRRFMWLAVQRRGLERQWHALRCAVYSAAPRAASAVAPEL